MTVLKQCPTETTLTDPQDTENVFYCRLEVEVNKYFFSKSGEFSFWAAWGDFRDGILREAVCILYSRYLTCSFFNCCALSNPFIIPGRGVAQDFGKQCWKK